jgi:hypothetical protein
MSKIYIDPLNLGPILIDTEDKSDHEPISNCSWGGWDESIHRNLRLFHGKTHTVETIKKMSQTHMGKKFSVESKKKMSIAKKGQLPWNTGKKHTEESRKKISEGQKKAWTKRKLAK